MCFSTLVYAYLLLIGIVARITRSKYSAASVRQPEEVLRTETMFIFYDYLKRMKFFLSARSPFDHLAGRPLRSSTSTMRSFSRDPYPFHAHTRAFELRIFICHVSDRLSLRFLSPPLHSFPLSVATFIYPFAS